MFDFSGLKVVSADDGDDLYSFVGICDGELRLPKGCKVWAAAIQGLSNPSEKFSVMQDAFLSLYRTLRVYRQAKSAPLANDRDSAQKQRPDGQEILGRHLKDNDIIYYRHLNMLDGILEIYDQLSILSLVQRVGRSEQLDHAKLHHYLDRATFFDDGSYVVDEMMLQRLQIAFEPVEIVQMYCFVLREIRKWLGEIDDIPSDIRPLAEQFFEHYLATGDGLFSFETWQRTRGILRERLEIIDQNTSYKDETYHELYNTLERFLWGHEQQSKDGIQWGISSFAPVWESMCLNYLIENRLLEIASCDTSGLADKLASQLTLLTNKEELAFVPGVIATLRSTEKLEGVFKLNGVQFFPDCTLIQDLEYYKNLLYRDYGVMGLADGSRTEDQKRVDLEIQQIYMELQSQKDPNQASAAQRLSNALKSSNSSKLSAFFLGKALSGLFKTNDGYYDSEKVVDSLIKNNVAAPFHLHRLRGMIWAVYFDENDENREIGSLNYRKLLYSYKIAMDCIASDKNKDKEINMLHDFAQLADAALTGNQFGQSTIVDFKYLTANYFQSEQNAVSVRTRSVRKQFVYEYLLEEKLGKEYSITSEFWIPDYNDDCSKIELGVSG